MPDQGAGDFRFAQPLLQRLKARGAVGPQHRHLTVEERGARGKARGGGGDVGEARRPVLGIAAQQVNAPAFEPAEDAIAVELDLVQPRVPLEGPGPPEWRELGRHEPRERRGPGSGGRAPRRGGEAASPTHALASAAAGPTGPGRRGGAASSRSLIKSQGSPRPSLSRMRTSAQPPLRRRPRSKNLRLPVRYPSRGSPTGPTRRDPRSRPCPRRTRRPG